MAQDIEKTIIDLVATDRLYMPSSSFDGKLERRKPKIAQAIMSYDGIENGFEGDRAYARVETTYARKSRTLRAGIDEFAKQYPREGKILNGIIEEERQVQEKPLYFGMHDGKRVGHDDYMAVLRDMGLPEGTAKQYYEVAIDIARSLQSKRANTERSIIIK